MPITLKDAPSTLPSHGKEIYVSAFNSAYSGTCKSEGDRRDECSSRIAWTAVKSKYRKSEGDKWIPKAEVQEFSMSIVKAVYDKASATRSWKATASDTEEDSYNDSMSLELFNDFLHRIETKEQPPEDFRSDFWSGGKPYLSVSHYPDLNGKGVPGPVDAVYIDGRTEAGRGMLKSKGRFDDTPIGRACFESVCADLYGDEPVPEDEKIRISIAFLDWKHRHKSSDYIFERSEDKMICPECVKELLEGEYGGKEFLRGHLIHLGMTRVPVNTRTNMEVERSMATRKEDAASIVGEDIAEELEEETKMVGKSEALVIKADEEEPLAEKAHKKEDYDEEEEDEMEDKKKKKQEKKSDVDVGHLMEALDEIRSEILKEPEVHPLEISL
jgi:cation transport regulator